jgi:hypothetical protein
MVNDGSEDEEGWGDEENPDEEEGEFKMWLLFQKHRYELEGELICKTR